MNDRTLANPSSSSNSDDGPPGPPAMRLTFDRPAAETALVREFPEGEPVPEYIEARFEPDSPGVRLVGAPARWFVDPTPQPGEILEARIPTKEILEAPGRTRSITIREVGGGVPRMATSATNTFSATSTLSGSSTSTSDGPVVKIPIKVRSPG